MLDLLLRILVIGAAAGGLAALVRALPWPRPWLKAKPLGCSVCMPGHGTWVMMLVWAGFSHWWADLRDAAVFYCAALAVAIWVYRLVWPPEVSL